MQKAVDAAPKTSYVHGTMKMTTSQKNTEVSRNWHLVDATNVPLGRLASVVATHLKGKHKPSYTPHTDGGDHVVVINADKIKLTGRKLVQEKFFWYTGYVGGIKEETFEDTLRGNHPERLVERSVRRMLPKTKLGRHMEQRLRVYAGESHEQEAQKPVLMDLKKALKGNK